MRWQVQEAKQRFGEMLRAVSRDGPQTISQHGHDAFVVIDIDEYRRLTGRRRDLRSVLLGPPYFSDEMSAIMDEIERDRGADKPRPVDLPEVGGGDER
ncbi:type II toxin-antitoxin system Phd/YefM family antitoxin [Frankia sp. AgB1.9]|uniref:type II toxin-antitoxin system Phd/YefM family antitoxin n=1 Tax=unclassified Frankia TaxID=2632575 RepID=UPI001932B320|nr:MULTISPECIES: type II toxin-antitoxin system Phd/YefM family antitoxin [unclassified Frankia]MBL7490860.1 type II toxin-antitoxin system Phd/YefM family antitoxin [Frankia sp. AgW1.1]MBL7550912.1 type II toxin-antitoxin system Phd/YefM family antitoxin [Frankia sp. AgB1.9]MBL7624421.1 type II toxin-antitoxin system Phd/YefM family antitoxin [Frankia sp. AgB1.8]